MTSKLNHASSCARTGTEIARPQPTMLDQAVQGLEMYFVPLQTTTLRL